MVTLVLRDNVALWMAELTGCVSGAVCIELDF